MKSKVKYQHLSTTKLKKMVRLGVIHVMMPAHLPKNMQILARLYITNMYRVACMVTEWKHLQTPIKKQRNLQCSYVCWGAASKSDATHGASAWPFLARESNPWQTMSNCIVSPVNDTYENNSKNPPLWVPWSRQISKKTCWYVRFLRIFQCMSE